METGKIIKYASIVAGAIITIILISKQPLPVILLGLSGAAYFVGDAIEKSKNLNLGRQNV